MLDHDPVDNHTDNVLDLNAHRIKLCRAFLMDMQGSIHMRVRYMIAALHINLGGSTRITMTKHDLLKELCTALPAFGMSIPSDVAAMPDLFGTEKRTEGGYIYYSKKEGWPPGDCETGATNYLTEGNNCNCPKHR